MKTPLRKAAGEFEEKYRESDKKVSEIRWVIPIKKCSVIDEVRCFCKLNGSEKGLDIQLGRRMQEHVIYHGPALFFLMLLVERST
jgi:hypothetical protein